MNGVRQRQYPEFVHVLERQYDKRLWNTQEFAAVQYMCEHVGDPRVISAQGLDACCALWQFLGELPEKLIGVEPVRFLAGYVPEPGVPLAPDDAATIAAWQAILGRLFTWSIEMDRRPVDDAQASTFQAEFLDLLDEVDTLLVPRLKFWRRFMPSS